jgi:hypothetical protein
MGQVQGHLRIRGRGEVKTLVKVSKRVAYSVALPQNVRSYRSAQRV